MLFSVGRVPYEQRSVSSARYIHKGYKSWTQVNHTHFLPVHVQAVVKSITKLNVVCPMCNEEKATATMKPCGHRFCPGKSFCIRVLHRVLDCFVLLVKIVQRE